MGEQKNNLSCEFKLKPITSYYLWFVLKILWKWCECSTSLLLIFYKSNNSQDNLLLNKYGKVWWDQLQRNIMLLSFWSTVGLTIVLKSRMLQVKLCAFVWTHGNYLAPLQYFLGSWRIFWSFAKSLGSFGCSSFQEYFGWILVIYVCSWGPFWYFGCLEGIQAISIIYEEGVL